MTATMNIGKTSATAHLHSVCKGLSVSAVECWAYRARHKCVKTAKLGWCKLRLALPAKHLCMALGHQYIQVEICPGPVITLRRSAQHISLKAEAGKSRSLQPGQ